MKHESFVFTLLNGQTVLFDTEMGPWILPHLTKILKNFSLLQGWNLFFCKVPRWKEKNKVIEKERCLLWINNTIKKTKTCLWCYIFNKVRKSSLQYTAKFNGIL